MTYALEEAGAPLGTLLLAPGEGPPRRRGPYGRILALETVADRRREGWGRVLLNSAVRIAHDAGWRTLDVEVPEEPEDGRRLCGAYGFRTEERHLGKFLL
jgi:GNAT superfamily N-acetyltransferase